jgi:hypothetical protein
MPLINRNFYLSLLIFFSSTISVDAQINIIKPVWGSFKNINSSTELEYHINPSKTVFLRSSHLDVLSADWQKNFNTPEDEVVTKIRQQSYRLGMRLFKHAEDRQWSYLGGVFAGFDKLNAYHVPFNSSTSIRQPDVFNAWSMIVGADVGLQRKLNDFTFLRLSYTPTLRLNGDKSIQTSVGNPFKPFLNHYYQFGVGMQVPEFQTLSTPEKSGPMLGIMLSDLYFGGIGGMFQMDVSERVSG